MSIRKILVPLSGQYDPEDPESLELPALETGFVIGRRFHAHVEVLCIQAKPANARDQLDPWIPGAAVDELLKVIDAENEARRKRARALFEAVSARFEPPPLSEPHDKSGFSASYLEEVGDVRKSLAVRGRLADLIVAARPLPPSEAGRPLMLEVALRETGRPVLICSKTTSQTFGRRVAVAWNGSAEASRAVAMAQDFLAAAEDVVVTTVIEDGPFEPNAESLVDYLRWHGVRAKSVTLEGSAASAGEVLLEQIAKDGADLLIMGAYTRDRIRRLIFGSVTGTVLAEADLPVLMVD